MALPRFDRVTVEVPFLSTHHRHRPAKYRHARVQCGTHAVRWRLFDTG